MEKVEKLIPYQKLPDLEFALIKFNKKAKKLNLPKIELIIKYPVIYQEIIYTNDDGTKDTDSVPMVNIEVTGMIPKIAGYSFVAKIEHRSDESGNFIGNVIKYHTHEVDNSYRNKLSECNHCKTKRYRKNTYLLEDSSKKIIQVGSECLKDFISKKDLENLVFLATLIQTLDSYSDFDRTSFKIRPTVEVMEFLTVCVDAINKHGWVPKSTSSTKEPSTYQVAWNYFHEDKALEDYNNLEMKEENRALVEEYISSQIVNNQNRSYFSENLLILIKQNIVMIKDCAMLATIAKEISKQEYKKVVPNKLNNIYNGTIGGLFKGKVKIKKINSFDSRFGRSYIVEMINLENNSLVKTFTTSQALINLEIGNEIEIQGAIKNHEEFNQFKSTVLGRVKITK